MAQNLANDSTIVGAANSSNLGVSSTAGAQATMATMLQGSSGPPPATIACAPPCFGGTQGSVATVGTASTTPMGGGASLGSAGTFTGTLGTSGSLGGNASTPLGGNAGPTGGVPTVATFCFPTTGPPTIGTAPTAGTASTTPMGGGASLGSSGTFTGTLGTSGSLGGNASTPLGGNAGPTGGVPTVATFCFPTTGPPTIGTAPTAGTASTTPMGGGASLGSSGTFTGTLGTSGSLGGNASTPLGGSATSFTMATVTIGTITVGTLG